MSAPKAKLFVIGATGQLGSAIISAIASHHHHGTHYDKHFEITAVVRKDTFESKDEKKAATVEKLKAAGVKLVTGDADKVGPDEIAKWIAGQDIVLSTVASYAPGPSVDLKFLEAVKLAKVPWFIPSSFGVDTTQAVLDSVPPLIGKRDVVDAVRKSGVNSIFIMTGLFMEYLISPFAGIDLANATVTAPYSLDAKLSTTKIEDIAHLTAEVLLQREAPHVKNQVVHLASDTASWSDLAKLLEEKYKKEFKKVVVSREDALAAVKADNEFKNMPGRFRVIFGEQKGCYWNESWNSKHAKNSKVTTLKEFIANLK